METPSQHDLVQLKKMIVLKGNGLKKDEISNVSNLATV